MPPPIAGGPGVTSVAGGPLRTTLKGLIFAELILAELIFAGLILAELIFLWDIFSQLCHFEEICGINFAKFEILKK